MQSHYAEAFDREMGCTEAEWLSWLPAALGSHAWSRGAGSVRVHLGESGSLDIRWTAGDPRVIALMRIPVLRVGFRFAGVADAARYAFMKRFDLYMQRGGG